MEPHRTRRQLLRLVHGRRHAGQHLRDGRYLPERRLRPSVRRRGRLLDGQGLSNGLCQRRRFRHCFLVHQARLQHSREVGVCVLAAGKPRAARYILSQQRRRHVHRLWRAIPGLVSRWRHPTHGAGRPAAPPGYDRCADRLLWRRRHERHLDAHRHERPQDQPHVWPRRRRRRRPRRRRRRRRPRRDWAPQDSMGHVPSSRLLLWRAAGPQVYDDPRAAGSDAEPLRRAGACRRQRRRAGLRERPGAASRRIRLPVRPAEPVRRQSSDGHGGWLWQRHAEPVHAERGPDHRDRRR